MSKKFPAQTLKQHFPALSSILSRKMIETQDGKSTRRVFIKSCIANSITLSLWGGFLVICHQFPHLNQMIGQSLVSRQLSIETASRVGSLVMMGVPLLAMGITGTVAAIYDYKFLKSAFNSVKASVMDKKSIQDDKNNRNCIKTIIERSRTILAGFRHDPSLRKKVIVCSAIKIASDSLEVYSNITKNPLIWAGSAVISGVAELKQLDLVLRAYRRGLQVQMDRADIPACVRLMRGLGMKHHADIVMIELDQNKKLRKRVDALDSYSTQGVIAATALGARNVTFYAVSGETAFLKAGAAMVGTGFAISTICAAGSCAGLAYAYHRGRHRASHSEP